MIDIRNVTYCLVYYFSLPYLLQTERFMKQSDFNKLSTEYKLTTVWDKGVFIDNHITKDIRINCFTIDKFFVEVIYDVDQNVITEVRSFKYGHSLDKYSNLKL